MTWLDLPTDDLFGISNLPYGVFSPRDGAPRAGVRVGAQVLDLAAVPGRHRGRVRHARHPPLWTRRPGPKTGEVASGLLR
ncbi:hypothetical protein [Streptomyces sp. NPDC093544]|uniref:hypothetical protein n=1 Tax=Streptomyces sp. NPDC093544 TaxID=3155200 RepID=UPI0034171E80